MPDTSLDSEKKYFSFFYLLIICFAVILFVGQYFIDRKDFYYLLGWQIVLHVLFIFSYSIRKTVTLKQILIAGILLRVGAALISPSLSDDVYRFIWDGQLIIQQQNPLLTTPDNYLAALKVDSPNYAYLSNLHGLINHPQFYTCYPPLMQMVFTFAAFFAGKSILLNIILIKLFVALADCVAIFFMMKILKKINIDASFIVLYALNPLVIIEGAGNAHFEVVQVSMMVISIYFLLEKKLFAAALFWGLAIVTKLLPLMLLPLLLRLLGFKKGMQFSVVSIIVAIITFLPFVNATSINGFGKSLQLYFQNFEFNASIYYLAREVGWWLKGYNYISFIGPFLMFIFLLLYAIIFFTKRKLDIKSFSHYSVIIFTLYYFLATTVHPWYIINLLPFALISNKKYALVWMAVAFLSYSAYGNINFKENYYLVAVEYLIVIAAMLYFFKKKNITVID